MRNVEWKAYFHQYFSDTDSNDISIDEDKHKNLRIPSSKHPDNFSEPLFDEIKTKLLGFVSNFEPDNPQTNLSEAERRGKHWVTKNINEEKIFISKADKGGATLILDYDKVIEVIKNELNDGDKFKKLDISIETKMKNVQNLVKEKAKRFVQEDKITEKDKKLITGLNKDNNMVHSPVFRSTIPYPYPSFKLHKLSSTQIKEKIIPPVRLIHATRDGPLYRVEKWTSPYLTEVSRQYCKEEFILDTPDLLNQISESNKSDRSKHRGKTLLFTLDVIGLYPSIEPQLALTALRAALSEDRHLTPDQKIVVLYEFTELIFGNSFVCVSRGCG